jgi:hypothetical protein
MASGPHCRFVPILSFSLHLTLAFWRLAYAVLLSAIKEYDVFIVVSLQAEKFIYGIGDGFFDGVSQHLLDVGWETLEILSGNRRNEGKPETVRPSYDFAGPPESPQLSFKERGDVGKGAQVEGIGEEPLGVGEPKIALEGIDVSDVLGSEGEVGEAESEHGHEEYEGGESEDHPNCYFCF